LDHIACIVKSCKQSEQPRFHGICGLYPRLFTPDVAVGMKMANFTELHFEYQTLKNGELDIDAYLMLKESYDKAGFMLSTEFFTGFINIGLPDDNLEIIIRHALNILEIMGSVIPKPYTPVPGTEVYKKYSCIINKDQIEMLSPHLFPLSSINGIMPEDYNELYRLMAFLNYKARQKTFDLFPPRVGFYAFRDSLRKEIWKIGEKEVSTSD